MGKRDRNQCKDCGSSDPEFFDPKHRRCSKCKPFTECRNPECNRKYTDDDDGCYAACLKCRTNSNGEVRTHCGRCKKFVRQHFDGTESRCVPCREKDSEEGKAKVLARRAANLEFPCEVEGCGRTFLTYDSVRNHHRVYHKDVYKQLLEQRMAGKRTCPVDGCGRVFRNQSKMERHKEAVHGKHECNVCGKGYKSQQSLRDHQRVEKHQPAPREARPYPCPHEGCTHSYSHIDALRRHKRHVHKLADPRRENWDQKEFVCAVAGCHSGYSTTKARNLHYRKKHKALLESGQLLVDARPKSAKAAGAKKAKLSEPQSEGSTGDEAGSAPSQMVPAIENQTGQVQKRSKAAKSKERQPPAKPQSQHSTDDETESAGSETVLAMEKQAAQVQKRGKAAKSKTRQPPVKPQAPAPVPVDAESSRMRKRGERQPAGDELEDAQVQKRNKRTKLEDPPASPEIEGARALMSLRNALGEQRPADDKNGSAQLQKSNRDAENDLPQTLSLASALPEPRVLRKRN